MKYTVFLQQKQLSSDREHCQRDKEVHWSCQVVALEGDKQPHSKLVGNSHCLVPVEQRAGQREEGKLVRGMEVAGQAASREWES